MTRFSVTPIIPLLLLAAGACSSGDQARKPDQSTLGDGPALGRDGPWKKQDGPAKKKDGPGKKQDGPGKKKDISSSPQDSGITVPYTGTLPQGTGNLSATLTVAGLKRTVKIYKPAKLGAAPPLMLTFHGTHGQAKDMLKAGSAYAREMADKSGVILVSPQARKMAKGDWDDHGPNDVYWETYPAVDPNKNPDLLLVQAMIHAANKAYKVDLKRVYTLGHSNGGFFSILAAMTLPNRIAAFAANSAGLVKCATMGSCSFVGKGTSCQTYKSQSGYCKCSGPEKPGPVATTGRKPPGYLVHASDDTTISVQYMCALSERMTALGYQRSLNIKSGHGHSMPYNLGVDAWAYLSKFKLP